MAAVEPLVIATNERQQPLASLRIQCVDGDTTRVIMTATTGTDGIARFDSIDGDRKYWFRPESNRNQAADGNYGHVRLAVLKKPDSDTVSPTAAADADPKEPPAAPPWLVFTTAPQAVDAGVRSLVITIKRVDIDNTLLTVGALIVYLYSTSAGAIFETYDSGTLSYTTVTQVTIADGASTASFYYTDDTTGNPVITASTEVLT